MKHKILSIFAAAAAVLVGTAACNKAKEQEFNPQDPAIMTITVQPDSIGVKAVDGAATFTFTAPDYWFVSSPVDWLSFEPASGKAGEVSLTVKAKQNIGGLRSALVTITSKNQRGQFKVGQEAWPYSASDWTLFGTVKGGDVVPMEDVGDQLEWFADEVPVFKGEVFKFRMGTSDADVLGLAGALTETDKNTYSGTLTKGGENIALPDHGYWDITLDLNEWTITATKDHMFPWGVIGTILEGDWTKDLEMEVGDEEWVASKVPYNEGEEFKFRLNGNSSFVLGLDGELAPVDGEVPAYSGKLKYDGASVTLPAEGYWNLIIEPESLNFRAEFVEKFPIPVDVKGTVIWDEKTVFDSWSATVVIPAEKFADAQVGQFIRVYYVDKGSDYNPIFKHVEDWSDWAELQGAKAEGEGYFESVITADVLEELKAKGLRFQGVGFTIVAASLVEIITFGEVVVWDVETPFADWSATIVVPAEGFADANAGDIIRVYISGKGDDFNPIFKHVSDWSDWSELQAGVVRTDNYFESVITADALDELKASGLRFQGVGFTITKVDLL